MFLKLIESFDIYSGTIVKFSLDYLSKYNIFLKKGVSTICSQMSYVVKCSQFRIRHKCRSCCRSSCSTALVRPRSCQRMYSPSRRRVCCKSADATPVFRWKLAREARYVRCMRYREFCFPCRLCREEEECLQHVFPSTWPSPSSTCHYPFFLEE